MKAFEHRIAEALRKGISLLLVLLLSLSAFGPALAEDLPEEVIVGHPTITKGDFFTEMFGNDTADIDVRALIHGYNLVNWDQTQGVYVIDPSVVEKVVVGDDDDGDRIYRFSLRDDLYYSDGSPITAWDYAFSLLLMMSPEIEQIGGKIYRAEHIEGAADYLTGRDLMLEGVRVEGERELSITLDHAFLPYFFEVGLLLCVPYPISVLAPGCKVYDDGEGVYIANAEEGTGNTIYSADLLRRTILDPETGYNSHPSVCSGPYVLTSYDGETCHFVRNEYFKGAWVGSSAPEGVDPAYVTQITDERGGPAYLVRPSIEKIAFTVVDNDTMLENFQDGSLHLVNKVVYGPAILELMQSGAVEYQSYPRIGLAFFTFSYDWPTVREKEVRQAIAWCMDRDALTQDYCGDFGVRVDGYYGIEQWEYLLINGQLDYPVTPPEDYDIQNEQKVYFANRQAKTEEEYDRMIAAWEALSLDNLTDYDVNIERANELLNKSGWTLNREGKVWRAGTDDVRCKMVDGELVALDLKMMYPEGNHIVDTIQERFINNLNACGIQLTLVPAPMQDLLYSYYRETERTTDMIYLATNFHVIVDPAITYSADPTANHLIWNNTYSDDEELYQRAVDMRKTQPGDLYGYVVKWIAFQERYNEVLPAIPLYSNIYFDFYVPQLENYWITEHVTWTQAILESYFTTKK